MPSIRLTGDILIMEGARAQAARFEPDARGRRFPRRRDIRAAGSADGGGSGGAIFCGSRAEFFPAG